jgi:hypothetical protein
MEINDTADNEYFGIDESLVNEAPTEEKHVNLIPPSDPEVEKLERVMNCDDNDSVITVNTAANQSMITGEINETIKEVSHQQLIPATPMDFTQSSTITSDSTMSTRVSDMETSLADRKQLLTPLLPPSLTPGTQQGVCDRHPCCHGVQQGGPVL